MTPPPKRRRRASLCSAEWHSAVSPSGTRQNANVDDTYLTAKPVGFDMDAINRATEEGKKGPMGTNKFRARRTVGKASCLSLYSNSAWQFFPPINLVANSRCPRWNHQNGVIAQVFVAPSGTRQGATRDKTHKTCRPVERLAMLSHSRASVQSHPVVPSRA